MPFFTSRIDAYKVIFAVQVHGYYNTYINLYNEGGAVIGVLSFYDGDTPSECIRMLGERAVEMWFPRSHFEDIATLLRVEKPVFLHVRDYETYAYLSTDPSRRARRSWSEGASSTPDPEPGPRTSAPGPSAGLCRARRWV